MTDHNRTASPSWPVFSFLAPQVAMWLGAPAAIVCACLYGLPVSTIVCFLVMLHVTGFGVTMGLHRLFTHRSFQTSRPVEWVLMVFGSMSGQSSPCYWVATHRRHHQLSDRPGDPHSPHAGHDGKGWWRRFWHAHYAWALGLATYDPTAVRDLTRRRDLAWIDRHWYAWYLLGLALPALAGYLIGGTSFDALMGLLWGGLLRHAVNQHASYLVNSAGHLWGRHDHDTGDHSRNNPILAVFTLGEGWHNNHHAHPYSARHGFRWWESDATWNLLWLMERVGLVWNVKRPKLDKAQKEAPPAEPAAEAEVRPAASVPAAPAVPVPVVTKG